MRGGTQALLVLLVAVVLLARPLAGGVAPATLAAFWATTLGQVVLPGVVIVTALRLRGAGTVSFALGQGAAVGMALQGIGFLAGRALGVDWLGWATVLAAALACLVRARSARGGGAGAPGRPEPAADAAGLLTLAVALGALLLQPLASSARPGQPVPFDLLFHAGTAGELRHRWPLEDPRVAGVPLHYHVLAYALPIAAADLAAAPLADPLLALAPLLWVLLLAFQMANAGRALVGDARAGALGAAVVLFHADPGERLGLGPGAFNSHLSTAIYGSPTTALSFVLLLGLVVALLGWLETGSRRELAVLALLAAATSATKTTVLPVVLGGLALAAVRAAALRRTDEAARFSVACAAAAAAAAPFTAWQTLGASSYSRMASFGFGSAVIRSPFAALSTERLGLQASPGVAALVLLVPWLAGFLGLAGVAAAVWLARCGRQPSPGQAWALATAGVSLAATLLVDAPGLSQLFLLYNGQLLIGLLAGAGVALALRRPAGARDAAVALLLALAAVPALAKLARALPASLEADVRSAAAAPSALESDYARGLAWLRAHAARDAVVFADNPSLLLSAFGEVRLYYETGLYTARSWEVGPGAEPFPERAALQQRLLRRPDAAALAAARAALAPRSRLLIVADAVQSQIAGGFVQAAPARVPPRVFFPPALFARTYSSSTLQVYEAREADGPR